MLKYLAINHAILIDHAVIDFQTGLNIITGETGAGKSAILQALKLLSGERYDTSILRHGEEKGWVEAAFEPSSSSRILEIFENNGLSIPEDNLFILRREFNSGGKSKCFINHQIVQRTLLQTVAACLMRIVSQHASQELLEIDTHKRIVDEYGGLEQEAKAIYSLYRDEKEQKKALETLLASEQERFRIMESLRREIEELTQAQLKEGEEEEIFAEYSLLTNGETISQSCQEILKLIQDPPQGALINLSKAKRLFDKLQSLDSTFSEAAALLQNAIIELEEAAYSVTKRQSEVENNPRKAEEINARLAQLAKLKKRYGNDTRAMLEYLEQASHRLSELENSDAAIEKLQDSLKTIENSLDAAAKQLSQKRSETAEALSAALTKGLKELNIPQAEVSFKLISIPRSQGGDEQIEIYFQPNKGEKMIPLKQCASGGEISRILLALHSLVLGEEAAPALIFDEIDANIGGETAALVGKKLREIGDRQQVISITHFPQVAAQAHHHLCIAKQESKGRTLTSITSLSKKEIEKELLRMAGGFFINGFQKDKVRA